MFAKWFGTRSTRRPAQENRFRPQLECLEGRLAPSSMGAHADGGNGNGNGNNGASQGQQHNNDNDHNNVHINNHDNYNIHVTNNYDAVLNTLSVNQTFGALGTSVSQLEQELFTALGQALMTTPGATVTDALNLVTNEFALGQDVGQLLTGILAGQTTNSTLLTQITNLETTIQKSPLEASAAGSLAGSLAFDIGLQLSLPQLQGSGQHS